jgi:large subunit ribosomal protein L10
MAIRAAKIPEWKLKQIDETSADILKAHTVAVVDIKGMPGKQFHKLRSKLRKDMSIKVMKKVVLERALEKVKEQRKDIQMLNDHLGAMPALILSQKSPFQLSKLLMDNKAPTFARAGDIAPENIEVDEGPTPFAPGPMIAELSGVGLKVKVDAGKIVVMKKSMIAKAGEPINQKVADILVKLGVQPMKIGLALAGAWENNFVFKQDVLQFDPQLYLDNLKAAASQAFRLTIGLPYPTKDNISVIVAKLFNEAKTLAMERNIFADAVMPQLMAKATAQASELNDYIETKKG